MINEEVTFEELQKNFDKLSMTGKAVVTTMIMWKSLSGKLGRMNPAEKAAIMLNHLKLIELSTELEVLIACKGAVAVCNSRDEFLARLDQLTHEVSNDAKIVTNNIDSLGRKHVSTH